MITEDYVSFEVAKLLKEKGFNGSCYKVWESHGDSQTLVGASWFVEGETVVNRESVDAVAKQYAYEYSLNNNVEGYLAPTLQMAMKWLREVHKLYMYAAHDSMENTWFARVYNDYKMLSDVDNYSTYEEACEAAITYCLKNLI